MKYPHANRAGKTRGKRQGPMFLNRDELKDLTGFSRRHHQCQQLVALGIPFKVRWDGSPIVLKKTVEQTLGLRVPAALRNSEPDLEALRRVNSG